MANTVFIHAAAEGTYIGNGGFIMLNELGVQLQRMGYTVAFFDHLNRLRAPMWGWTGYDVSVTVPFAHVKLVDAPIVTTWLYSWLDTLKQHPAIFPRLRYWCSGELLRDDPRYDESRIFIRQHVPEIAINNPSLAKWYSGMGITPRWEWTNWVRELFTPDPDRREPGTIGYTPDLPFGNPKSEPDIVGDALRAVFGDEAIIPCVGTQAEVARAMQRCDLFLAWSDLWPLVCGAGESFGLSAFEAMACGCAVIARRHCGNEVLLLDTVRLSTSLSSAIRRLMDYVVAGPPVFSGYGTTFIEHNYRFDDQRRDAIRGYIDG
ncbi:MAG: glycosyltransferase family 4 protein [Planctomycetota bacterium]|jgi:hypothetical protein